MGSRSATVIFIVFILASLLNGCEKALNAPRATVSLNGDYVSTDYVSKNSTLRETARVLFHIEGMDCGDCAPTIAVELKRLPGIAWVRVNQLQKEAEVKYDPNLVSIDQMIATLKTLRMKGTIKR
jgi:copper chaperone CopZ